MEDLNLDLTDNSTMTEVSKPVRKTSAKAQRTEVTETVEYVSCLRKEKITVRYIPKESGMITNPKHVFYGGMAENAVRMFTVPILESNG